MQWMNDREKQLGIELGFVIRSGGRSGGGKILNVVFSEADVNKLNPREGNTRPASEAEGKMWRALLNNI